jgi:hypothetical protein
MPLKSNQLVFPQFDSLITILAEAHHNANLLEGFIPPSEISLFGEIDF